ncbi:unnamed protein product, partial [Discosporangium mesarthrocarpum]
MKSRGVRHRKKVETPGKSGIEFECVEGDRECQAGTFSYEDVAHLLPTAKRPRGRQPEKEASQKKKRQENAKTRKADESTGERASKRPRGDAKDTQEAASEDAKA